MQNKTSKYFKYAIGEIILVVIGILIALQINNWNEGRKDMVKETIILRNLQRDFKVDVKNITRQINMKNQMLSDYNKCLDILTGNTDATKDEFNTYYQTIVQVGGIDLNATTFNNLQNNGEIKLISNQSLADSIVAYYNTNIKGWSSSLQDYTRNVIGPYVLQYDYIPDIKIVSRNVELQNHLSNLPKNEAFNKPQRTLEDYKNNYFMINALKFKSRNIIGILNQYYILLDYANNLNKSIEKYLEIND